MADTDFNSKLWSLIMSEGPVGERRLELHRLVKACMDAGDWKSYNKAVIAANAFSYGARAERQRIMNAVWAGGPTFPVDEAEE